MKDHYLKTDRAAFTSSMFGEKTYEIRYDDRGYQVGDILILQETNCTGQEMKAGAPLAYTGREHRVEVKHILLGPIYGLAEGWIIMSVGPEKKIPS